MLETKLGVNFFCCVALENSKLLVKDWCAFIKTIGDGESYWFLNQMLMNVIPLNFDQVTCCVHPRLKNTNALCFSSFLLMGQFF